MKHNDDQKPDATLGIPKGELKAKGEASPAGETKPKAKAKPKAKPKGSADQQTKPEEPAKKIRKVTNPLEHAEYFGKQYTKTSDLPDPGEMLKILATGIVQVLAGERQVDQLARMVTEDLYLQLRDAALNNIRKRAATPGKPKNRLQIEVRRV